MKRRNYPVLAKTFNQALNALGAVRVRRSPRKLPKQSESRGVNLEKYGMSADETLMSASMGILQASLPERRVYGWLVRHKIDFEYQAELLGGRRPGGAVVDFIVALRQPPLVLRIMSYWHTSPASKAFDDVQAQEIEELGYQTEDIWEYELETPDETNSTMMRILYGMPKPSGGLVGSWPSKVCPRCGRAECFQCSAGSWYGR